MRPSNMGNSYGRGILGPGPLMTGHLKVRNLDRELDALRRKREMIQREQEMLSLEFGMDRKRQYEQVNRNVPNMYGEAWQPPPKRANFPQQVKPWRASAQDYPMNMSKPMSSNYIPSLLDNKVDMPQRPFVPPAPMHKPIVHPILRDSFGGSPAFKVRNNYGASQTNKVMKKKPQNPPNKLNSYPVNERKDLVSMALDKPKLSFKNTNNGSATCDSLRLREGQKPSQRVIGRLELALGNLVKEIRSDNKDNAQFNLLFAKSTNQRVLKQAIRERIRIVMLNQLVTSVIDIVSKYRQKFPKESDKDIVDLMINKSDSIIETDNPEEFLKKNIDSILEKKLQEMSLKLKDMYSKTNRTKVVKEVKSIKLENATEKESTANSDEAKKIIRNLTGKYVSAKECNVLAKFYTDLIEDILEKKLPEHLPKYKDQFLKIFNLDHEIDPIKTNKTNNVSSCNTDEVIEIKDDHSEAEGDAECVTISEQEADESCDMVAKVIPENRETQENSVDQQETELSVDQKETEINVDQKETEISVDPKETEINVDQKETEISIDQKEIEISVDQKETKISVDQKDTEKSSTETNPVLIEDDQVQDMAPVVVSPKPVTPNRMQLQSPTTESAITKPATVTPKKAELSTVPQTPKTTQSGKDLLYFIKLIGRPTLPARSVICDFLNNYQPSSIKKHKSINNLLVIGFNNEDDYNRILKANETVIGGITIIIKGSDKVNSGKDNESTQENHGIQNDNSKEINGQTLTKDKSANELKDETETEKEVSFSIEEQNQEAKDFIGKELDDQITDLLSTIKEAEEKTEENCNNAPNETCDDVSQESRDAEKGSLAAVKEAVTEVKNEDKNDSDNRKGPKGVRTPARSSSRLANVTPSTIRTRRASRLMQDQ